MTIKVGTEVEIKKIPKSHKHLIGKMATVIRQSHNRRDLYLVRVGFSGEEIWLMKKEFRCV